MKKARLIVFCFAILSLVACNKAGSASNNTAQPAASNSNQSAATDANANSSKPGDSAAAKNAEPARLLGTYESREVHNEGVVTLISELKTRWRFSEDGTYQRQSEVKGRPYHADAGKFRVEPPDKLILSIEISGLKSGRKMQNPPLIKTHQFSLSPDGNELRLTSPKGSIGIFERTAKPTNP